MEEDCKVEETSISIPIESFSECSQFPSFGFGSDIFLNPVNKYTYIYIYIKIERDEKKSSSAQFQIRKIEDDSCRRSSAPTILKTVPKMDLNKIKLANLKRIKTILTDTPKSTLGITREIELSNLDQKIVDYDNFCNAATLNSNPILNIRACNKELYSSETGKFADGDNNISLNLDDSIANQTFPLKLNISQKSEIKGNRICCCFKTKSKPAEKYMYRKRGVMRPEIRLKWLNFLKKIVLVTRFISALIEVKKDVQREKSNIQK